MTITYDELYRAADILWPGEADSILADPTDAQIDMILAVISTPAVVGFAEQEWGTLSTMTTSTKVFI